MKPYLTRAAALFASIRADLSARRGAWIPVGVVAGVLFFGGFLLLATPRCGDGGCLTVGQLTAYQPPEPPRVHDRRGELIGQLPGERRLVVKLGEIPAIVRDGFVAVEDRRFWEHSGVDLRSFLRAGFRNLTSASVEEGASTITMQLVRNVFDVRDYGRWRRKLVELRLGLAVEDLLSKEDILGLYLNQIYLGGGVYGVETAARSYFDKSASELSVPEAALVVGLAKNPEGYNPRNHPERAKARRAVVLDIFAREGLLTHTQAEAAKAAEIELAPEATREAGSYYFSAIDRRIRELFPDPLDRQGLRVHTGYDAALQEAAEEELAAQISAVEAGRYGRYRHPVPEKGEPLERTEGGSPFLQGMVVAMDSRTGTVRAVVGGRDFDHTEFDRALQARRQPGSAFKPLVWTAALEAGMPLAETVETTPMVFRMAGGREWRPQDDQSDGTPLTLRQALVVSSNLAAVRVGERAGVERVAALAKRLGISSEIPLYPSIFLGAADVVPVELVAAYAAFGNGGRRVTPHFITRIEDREGKVLWTPQDRVAPSLDPGVAYLALSAMQDVVDHGTGWRVRQAGFAGLAAGKTGTTDGGKDVWFVGMTPELVAGVWLGFDEPRTILPGASGGQLAAPVWGRMMAAGGAGTWTVTPGWTRPANVEGATIDLETGYLATPYCPPHQVVEELFLQGTAPVDQCPTHQGDFFDKLWRGIARLIR